MKLTRRQLRRIIKEEKAKIIQEQRPQLDFGPRGGRREALSMLEEYESMGIDGMALAEYLVGSFMTGDDAYASMVAFRDEL